MLESPMQRNVKQKYHFFLSLSPTEERNADWSKIHKTSHLNNDRSYLCIYRAAFTAPQTDTVANTEHWKFWGKLFNRRLLESRPGLNMRHFPC